MSPIYQSCNYIPRPLIMVDSIILIIEIDRSLKNYGKVYLPFYYVGRVCYFSDFSLIIIIMMLILNEKRIKYR